MGKRLRHVAMTYLGNRKLWVLGAFSGWMLLMCVGMRAGTNAPPVGVWPINACLSCGMVLAGMGVWGHAKTQFADPRARLTPDFAGPHLVMAWIASAVMILIWGAGIWFVLQIGFTGSLAVACLLFAAAGWLVYGESWVAALLLVASIFGAASESGQQVFAALFAPSAWLTSTGIVAASLAGLGVLGARIAAITEENPAYRRQVMRSEQLAWHHPSTAQPPQRMGRFSGNFVDSRMRNYLARRPGWLRRVERWRMPLTPMPLWIPMLLMIGVSVMFQRKGGQFEFAWMQCGIAAIVPLSVWRKRRAMLAQELLRPIDRKTFLRELGAALALDMIDIMGMATVFILVVYAVLKPRQLSEPQPWLMMATVWSAATITFGCGAWLLRVRSEVTFFVGTILALMATNMVLIFPIGLTEIKDMQQYGHLVRLVPPACLAVGLVISGLAYRRWLTADMG